MSKTRPKFKYFFIVFGINFGVSPDLKSERFVKDILQKSIKLLPSKKDASRGSLASILGLKFIKKSIPRGIENYIVFDVSK